MINKKAFIFVLAIFLITIMLSLLTFSFYIGNKAMTYYHEQAHSSIFASYGINSTIEIDELGNGMTITEEGCPNEECEYLHNLNEVFGYTMHGIIFNLWLMYGLSFIVAIMFLLKGKNESQKEKEKKNH